MPHTQFLVKTINWGGQANVKNRVYLRGQNRAIET
jgi:hypothetical protein